MGQDGRFQVSGARDWVLGAGEKNFAMLRHHFPGLVAYCLLLTAYCSSPAPSPQPLAPFLQRLMAER